jgi:mono/diheme cytochrome c family protein
MRAEGRRGLGIATIAVSAIAVALSATAVWFVAASLRADAQVAQGRAVYVDYCAACHGVDLEGAPDWQTSLADGRMPAPPHDASGHTWHHSDTELRLMVEGGMGALVPGYESDMPAFGDIVTPEEIDSVLAYIKSTWPRRERQYQAERSSR